MNIEIANRLVQLRKEKNLSQEALASELGISRQAVSKWERAEASPDTDNLILLAKLYGLSLDELLKSNEEDFISGKKEEQEDKKEDENDYNDGIFCQDKDGDYVHLSLSKGIHVKEKNGDEVHVGWSGIHVKGTEHGEPRNFDLGKEGVFINGKQYNKDDWHKEWKESYVYDFPIGVIVSVAYIYIGIVYGAWHPGWLIFGIIPLFHSIISAFKKRDIMRFAYPVLILMIIGYAGFVQREWYPAWLLLLTIPLFYSIFGYFRHMRNRYKKNKDCENFE